MPNDAVEVLTAGAYGIWSGVSNTIHFFFPTQVPIYYPPGSQFGTALILPDIPDTSAIDPIYTISPFVTLSSVTQGAALSAISRWGSFINYDIVPGAAAISSEIIFAATSFGPNAGGFYGFAGLPNAPGWGLSAGDVWLNTDMLTNATFAPGSSSYYLILHELGHALGLTHPNFNLTFHNLGDPYDTRFSNNSTIMSLLNPDHSIWTTSAVLPSTPRAIAYDSFGRASPA